MLLVGERKGTFCAGEVDQQRRQTLAVSRRKSTPSQLIGGLAASSKVENRLFCPVISDRSSSHSSLGILRKTSTTLGSNWVPEQRRISSRAASKLLALR